jgi:chemotaxis receptor (MCP) glutamine deamidase CheD
MNHFMLPQNAGDGGDRWLDPQVGLATRYGSFAMERLINDLLKGGARRERLEIKLFGGGRILAGQTDVGTRNISFVRDFLCKEGYKAAAEDLGGSPHARLLSPHRPGLRQAPASHRGHGRRGEWAGVRAQDCHRGPDRRS